MDEHMMAAEIAALKNEIETLKGMVKAERAKVVQELREWFNDEENIYGDAMGNPVLCKRETLTKLDSMEDKTNV